MPTFMDLFGFTIVLAVVVAGVFAVLVVTVYWVGRLIADCGRLSRRVERLDERLREFERWIIVP